MKKIKCNWYQALECDSPKASIPVHGKPIDAAIIHLGTNIRDIVYLYKKKLTTKEARTILHNIYNLDFSLSDIKENEFERAAWSITNLFLLAKWLKGSKYGLNSEKIINMFDLNSSDPNTHSTLKKMEDQATQSLFSKIDTDDNFIDLQPYILDSLGPTSRLDVIKNSKLNKNRIVRKKNGVFYTPTDVAEFITNYSIDRIRSLGVDINILDPACGSGVFLRVYLRQILSSNKNVNIDKLIASFSGFDINELSLDNASFILLQTILKHYRNIQPIQTLKKIRERLKKINFLKHSLPSELSAINVIVGNPPYGKTTPHSISIDSFPNYNEICQLNSIEIHNLFALKSLNLLKNKIASFGMVLPLSLSFSQSQTSQLLRETINEQKGEWLISFYDREPHALFGENAKTRNCIVLHYNDCKSSDSFIYTTGLRKWNGKERLNLLPSTIFIKATSNITKFIPKLSNEKELNLWKMLSNISDPIQPPFLLLSETLSDIFKKNLLSPVHIIISPTAYNYIGCALSCETYFNMLPKPITSSKYHIISTDNKEQAYSILSILSSCTCHWFWKAVSDGFHINKTFLKKLPFWSILKIASYQNDLSQLGEMLWKNMINKPNISNNAGKYSISFNSLQFKSILNDIDNTLTIWLTLTSKKMETKSC